MRAVLDPLRILIKSHKKDSIQTRIVTRTIIFIIIERGPGGNKINLGQGAHSFEKIAAAHRKMYYHPHSWIAITTR